MQLSNKVAKLREKENNSSSLLSQDPTEMVLLSLVIFYSSDMLDLTDRTRVEQTQLNYVLLLQKYISVRYVITGKCIEPVRFVLSVQNFVTPQ